MDEDSLDLDYDLSGAIGFAAALVTEYRQARAQLGEAQRTYETAQALAAHELRQNGVTMRDAAARLDVSFQRVQQVTSSKARARRAGKATGQVKESA